MIDKYRLRGNTTEYATVAQLVEQLIRNQQVAGSSPASSSTRKRPPEIFSGGRFFLADYAKNKKIKTIAFLFERFTL